MGTWGRFWAEFLEDETGQTAVEYMLIIAVIVGVVLTLGQQFKTRFKSLVDTVFTQIEKKVNNIDGAF